MAVRACHFRTFHAFFIDGHAVGGKFDRQKTLLRIAAENRIPDEIPVSGNVVDISEVKMFPAVGAGD